MTMILKKWRVIMVTLIGIAVVIYIINSSSFIIGILKVLFEDYKTDKIIQKYESKDSRIDFFRQNESLFLEMVDIFKTYSINFMGIEDYCTNDYRYIINEKLTVCANEEISLENLKQLNNSSVLSKYKKLNMSEIRIDQAVSQEYSNYSIIFVYLSSLSHAVSFEYCLSELCDTNDKIYYYDTDDTDEKEVKNRIDDRWFTTYIDAPAI